MTTEQHDSKTDDPFYRNTDVCRFCRTSVPDGDKACENRETALGCSWLCGSERSRLEAATPSPQSPAEPGRGDPLARQERMAELERKRNSLDKRIFHGSHDGVDVSALQSSLRETEAELSHLRNEGGGEEAQVADPRVARMATHCCVPEIDEPFFVLLGRDPQAPWLVQKWAQDRAQVEPGDKATSAYATAKFMRMWKDAHPERGLSMEAFARIASPSGLPAREAIERAARAVLASGMPRATTKPGGSMDEWGYKIPSYAVWAFDKACKELEAALQPLSQGNGEPVAWRNKPPIASEPWTITTDREMVEMRKADGWLVEPPYAAPEGFPKPKQNPGGVPCGECHLKPGETCDICGAIAAPPSQPEGVREALAELLQRAWSIDTELSRIGKAESDQRLVTPDANISVGELRRLMKAISKLANAITATTPARGLVEAAEWHEQQAEINEITEAQAEACGSPERVQKHHRDLAAFHKESAKHFRTLSAKGGAG